MYALITNPWKDSYFSDDEVVVDGIYKGVLMLAEEDARVHGWIDDLPKSARSQILAIAYRKGMVSLLWRTHIPIDFTEHGAVEPPSGDSWSIDSSICLQDSNW